MVLSLDSLLLSPVYTMHTLDAGCHSGTCQPQTITAIKGLPLLGSSSRWEEPVEEGDAVERGGHSQHCLKGLVSILGEGEDFEEIISVRGMTEGEDLDEGMEDSFQMRGRKP